jgi:hypothetical protein
MPNVGDIFGDQGQQKLFEAVGNLVNTIIHELETAVGKPELFQGLELGNFDQHAVAGMPAADENGLADLVHLPNDLDQHQAPDLLLHH